jgi:hypothetical protein
LGFTCVTSLSPSGGGKVSGSMGRGIKGLNLSRNSTDGWFVEIESEFLRDETLRRTLLGPFFGVLFFRLPLFLCSKLIATLTQDSNWQNSYS